MFRSWRTFGRGRRRWGQARPIPTGVHLELDDGEMIGPLPLRYEGRCSRGHHKWAALAAARLASRIRGVAVTDMPLDVELSLRLVPDSVLADLLNQPHAERNETRGESREG